MTTDTHPTEAAAPANGQTPPATTGAGWLRRHRLLSGLVAAAVAAAGTTAYIVSSDGTDDGSAQTEAVAFDTATITRRDLTSTDTLDGTVELGDAEAVTASASGTVLALVDEGVEVVRGDVLYTVDSEPTDVQLLQARRQVVTTASQLTAARDARDDLTQDPTAADLASLQTSLRSAEDNLEALLEPPTEASIADAEARVQAAQEALDDLFEPPTDAEVAQAEARVLQAEEALETLQEPASDGAIAAADVALADAEDALQRLRDGLTDEEKQDALADADAAVDAALDALSAARDTKDARWLDLVQAQDAYCDGNGTTAAACGSLPLSAAAEQALRDEAETLLATDDPDAGTVVPQIDALLGAESAYAAANTAWNRASVAYQDAIDARDELEDELDEPATQEELDAAEAAVLQAQEALDTLREGPTDGQLAKARADVASAQEALADLLDGPGDLQVARAEADLLAAQDTLEALVDGPTEADIEVARLNRDAAQERLDDVLGGATATDLTQAQANVDAAALALEIAQADLSSLLEGPRTAVVMYGTMPAWRTLSVGDAPGRDVVQLQENLNALGFGPVDTDGVFGSATAAAVRAWQASVGMDATGEVALGTVVFVPGPSTVFSVTDGVRLGTTLATGVAVAELVPLEALSTDGVAITTQRVIATLDVDDRSLVDIGDEVSIELPDDTVVAGTIVDIALVAVATSQGGTASQLEVEVLPVEPIDDLWTDASVDVDVASSLAEDVLTVPVSALLALAEGGYALEVVLDDGTTTLVGVDVGDFADGIVEVSGANLVEGLEVVIAG